MPTSIARARNGLGAMDTKTVTLISSTMVDVGP